jgi:hypothetical protein
MSGSRLLAILLIVGVIAIALWVGLMLLYAAVMGDRAY